MNRTHIEHVSIALIVQFLAIAATGNVLAGSLLAIGIFIGREHAQAEMRVMAAGFKRDDTLVELVAFLPRWWDRDAVLDLLAPAAAVGLVAYLVS